MRFRSRLLSVVYSFPATILDSRWLALQRDRGVRRTRVPTVRSTPLIMTLGVAPNRLPVIVNVLCLSNTTESILSVFTTFTVKVDRERPRATNRDCVTSLRRARTRREGKSDGVWLVGGRESPYRFMKN
jgi:hypothetical protein